MPYETGARNTSPHQQIFVQIPILVVSYRNWSSKKLCICSKGLHVMLKNPVNKKTPINPVSVASGDSHKAPGKAKSFILPVLMSEEDNLCRWVRLPGEGATTLPVSIPRREGCPEELSQRPFASSSAGCWNTGQKGFYKVVQLPSNSKGIAL